MHGRRALVRRGIAAPALTLIMVASVLSGVVPAQAGVGARVANPVRVSATSAVNSAGKSVVVACPAGTRVYGAGAQINGGGSVVTLDDITPNLTLTNVLATAFESVAFAGNWSVTAFAVCGPNTRNLQRIQFTSVTNSLNKTVFVGCPTGLRLYGLGAELNGAIGRVFFDDLTPNSALTGVTVTAFENGAFAGNWNVTGFAICGNPAARMLRVLASSATNSVGVKSVAAGCPAGTRVHGVGAQLDGAFGAVILDDVRPNAGVLSTTATGVERGPFAGNWRVTAFAICSS